MSVLAVAIALLAGALGALLRYGTTQLFGRLGDLWGRKPALMLDILCYSSLGALAAFSPNLTVFLILRALFGVAMGGEWGLGSSLAMESIPPQARGLVSGILQCGYPTGFLYLAAIAFCALAFFALLMPETGQGRERSREGAWRFRPAAQCGCTEFPSETS